MVAEVEHSDDMRMRAEPAHRLSFAGYTSARYVIEALCLDEGEGDVPIEKFVVREVDLLLAALSQKSLYLVTAICEGGGLLRGRLRANRE